MADLEDKLKAASPRVSGSSSPTACSRWKATLPSCRHRGPGAAVRRGRRDGRLPCDRGARPSAGHRGALRHAGSGDIITSTWAKPWAAPPAASRPAPPRWRLPHAALPPAALLQRLPPTVAGSALAAVQHLQRHPELVTGSTTMHATSASASWPRVQALPGRPPSSGDPGRNGAGDTDERGPAGRGVFVTGFAIRWSRRARPDPLSAFGSPHPGRPRFRLGRLPSGRIKLGLI